ncbi:MAG: type II toxin-antitoxin system RelE/ParE family toxin [Treponema sp.]|nr:type II toxin-antitoxin system RelE/ParE family toxin [Treponema sp.]
MEVLQTNRFKKAYKKLHPNQLAEVNTAIETIINDPEIGEQKKGNLSWLRVYKFTVLGQLTLLGYSVETADRIMLTLVDIGSHENFYRDLH